MALVVENGTGLSNADSYVSVGDADIYFAARNNSDWDALDTAEKEAALLYATAYIDSKYTWPGYVYNTNQSLDWPRNSAYDDEERVLSGVPLILRNSVCELAVAHAVNGASLTQTFDRGGAVKREKVGSLEVEYMDGAGSGRSYPFIDVMLSPITATGGSNSVQIVRS